MLHFGNEIQMLLKPLSIHMGFTLQSQIHKLPNIHLISYSLMESFPMFLFKEFHC